MAEDQVTIAVIERLIKDYAHHLSVKAIRPARGGQMKSQIEAFNKLSLIDPVILLTDLDTEDCAPIAKAKLLGNAKQNPDFLLNIAVDEAEAWLYADSVGFSSYLKVPLAIMPPSTLQKMGGMTARCEVDVPIKTSLHLTSTLIRQSENRSLVQMIRSRDGRCKGPQYNAGIVPFIKDNWNPERARQASYSLDKTIQRIIALDEKFS